MMPSTCQHAVRVDLVAGGLVDRARSQTWLTGLDDDAAGRERAIELRLRTKLLVDVGGPSKDSRGTTHLILPRVSGPGGSAEPFTDTP
jgi:hypothetical protein